MATGRTTGILTWRYFMVTAMTRPTADGAYDKGPGTQEPRARETNTRGSVAALGWATTPATVTYAP